MDSWVQVKQNNNKMKMKNNETHTISDKTKFKNDKVKFILNYTDFNQKKRF